MQGLSLGDSNPLFLEGGEAVVSPTVRKVDKQINIRVSWAAVSESQDESGAGRSGEGMTTLRAYSPAVALNTR